MPLSLASRADFTLENFHRVAWRDGRVRFSSEALARMAASRAAFLRLIDTDPAPVIYGVTTGYGQQASRRLDPEARRQHAARPPVATIVAFGPPLPRRVTRGIVFARLANYVEGHAAISPPLAEAVAGLLDEAALPAVSMAGQGGAGEILSLGPLFAGLAARFDLGEKESLALINGSPSASALIADAALAMRHRLDLVEQVLALSAEAIRAPLEAYAAEFETLWEDPHETAALRSLRGWMAGGSAERRPYQAPVSYRILPRVLGQARRALAAATEVAAISLKSVTDNPVFLPPDADHPNGRVYSNGGYHNGKAYPALDDLAAVAADLCLIADRHAAKLLDGRYSLLPDQLLAGDGYLGCLAMAQVGYAEEARRAAQRTFLPGSEGGGFGQNDVAPPTFLAWRGQERAGWCLDASLATLGAIASQALFATDRPAPPALRDLLTEIRDHFPPVAAARPLAPDAERLAAAFRARVYEGVASAE
ncbi:aromatic amino acid lyase [Rhodospirillaceae bacterium SYSU D60014]|uniref:aromatic amino acid lyase n=1 Tax=Virgifigura deserti TaxID=2268457 RepID=UPI000E672046